MTSKTLKRTGLGSGLATAAALALFAFAAVGSAAADTQHWAGSSRVPYGSSQSFSGEATPGLFIEWIYGGALVEMECSTLSTTGTVANPTGGGAGTIESGTFRLGNCRFVGHVKCAIEGQAIDFSPFTEVLTESGNDRIRDSWSTTYLNIVDAWTGSKCPIKGSKAITAQISATQAAESAEFVIYSAEFEIAGWPAKLSGRFALKNASNEGLVLSSSDSPGAPHWYLGSAGWTALPTGESTPYTNNGSMSLSIAVNLFGVDVTISCSGAAGGIEGSVLNPSGGGAGTAGLTMTFSGCSLSGKSGENCAVTTPLHPTGLSGLATEVGKVPAVEFAPAEGTEIGSFTISKKEGKKCNLTGTFGVTGKLIASSTGDGSFNLSSSELKVIAEPATASGSFALETTAGKTLRLQP